MGRASRMKARRRELRRAEARVSEYLCGDSDGATGKRRCFKPAAWDVQLLDVERHEVRPGVGMADATYKHVRACEEHAAALRRSGAAVSFRKIERPAESG